MNYKAWCCAVLLAGALTASSVQAAGLRTVELSAKDVPAGFTAGSTEGKALFVGRTDMTARAAFMDMGLLSAHSFLLNYKDNDVVKYAWIGDVRLGDQGLQRLGVNGSMPVISAQGKDLEASSLPEVAAVVNSGRANILAPYTVVEPLKEIKKGLYTGTLQVASNEKGVTYKEVLHMVVYDNIYFGPTLRILAIAGDDDALLWPKLKQMMNVTK